MQLTTLVDRYDDRLRTPAYAEVDASPNGLQVGRTAESVSRIAFAVDAAMATIQAAREWNADMLVTHHGILWGGVDRVTGRVFERVNALVSGDIGLYVSHLPLDGHQELGNAAGVADVLELRDREPFGRIGEEYIGQQGQLSDPVAVDAVAGMLERDLSPDDQDIRVFAFGPDELQSVGIVTGSGADWLDDAAAAGLDALVTGEGKHQLYHAALESGVTVVLAGHYATETFGVRSLQALADDWGLETRFFDHPTGL